MNSARRGASWKMGCGQIFGARAWSMMALQMSAEFCRAGTSQGGVKKLDGQATASAGVIRAVERDDHGAVSRFRSNRQFSRAILRRPNRFDLSEGRRVWH